jgi:hypothetical protein
MKSEFIMLWTSAGNNLPLGKRGIKGSVDRIDMLKAWRFILCSNLPQLLFAKEGGLFGLFLKKEARQWGVLL